MDDVKKNKFDEYRNGGEGCIKWIEDHIWVEIDVYAGKSTIKKWVPIADLPDDRHIETGRSYRYMWEKQKDVLRKALVMENGIFKHKLIILCWPRGEGKTVLVCLIQLWKFFCWPSQDIVFCANSKEQTKIVQFSIIKDIILNSPKLLRAVGRRNIQEKTIRLISDNKVVSTIFSISSFSGLVSNAKGYGFSEIFEMKKGSSEKPWDFWYKVDGSIRRMINAIGVIDTTVSSKDHILYHLYNTSRTGEDPTIFFSYRYSTTGDPKDYWHPNTTAKEMKSYRLKFVLGGFERYFLNLWSAGAEKVFTEEQVNAFYYLGVNKSFRNHNKLIGLLEKRRKIFESDVKIRKKGVKVWEQDKEIEEIEKSLWPVNHVYEMDSHGNLIIPPVTSLEELGDMLDTDWAILSGFDRADPVKRRTAARTIFVTIAKGLPGSRTNPNIEMLANPSADPVSAVDYIYFLLYLQNVADHSLEQLKREISSIHQEYSGIETLSSERWGAWDLVQWAENLDITVELVNTSYNVQRSAFTEFYNLMNTGRFKGPVCPIAGSSSDDIIREELLMFDHDSDKKWFGSPEKNLKYGVQDDVVYAINWAIYGGRFLTVDDFKPRQGELYFGTMIHPRGLVGNW